VKRKGPIVKILVIGEGPNSRDKTELGYVGKIGGFLAGAMKLNRKQYNQLVITRNLLPHYCGEWSGKLLLPAEVAKRESAKLVPLMKNRISILLGDRVARAFGYAKQKPFGVWRETIKGKRKQSINVIVRLPLPTDRWWDDECKRLIAIDYLRTIARACMLK